MNESLEVQATLTNDKVRLTASSRSNPPVVSDYFPPLGDGEGYTGLELLLMSLAVCSATSILFLLRKQGTTVSGFDVKASGGRRTQHPTSFEKIHLDFTLDSSDAEMADLANAIASSEQMFCPVWAMLKNSAEITTSHKIRTRQVRGSGTRNAPK